MRIGFPALLALSAVVLGTSRADVDEFPMKTEDGWVLAPRTQRLRFGAAFWEEDGGPEIQEYAASWARGFDGGFELGVALPYVFSDPEVASDEDGVSDLRLHAEFDLGRHLFFEWENPVDALSAAFTYFPRFGKSPRRFELYDRTFETSLSASKDMEWAVGHGSLGIVWYDDTFERAGENAESALFFRLAATRRYAKGSELIAEFLWQEPPDKNENTEMVQVGVGTRFPVRPNLTLDGGAWLGLTDTAPDAQVAFGASYHF